MRNKILVILAAAVSLVFGGIAGATLPTGGALSKELARSTFQSVHINESSTSDIVVAKNSFPPGASSGWHSHPGMVTIGIRKGSLRLTRVSMDGGPCQTLTYRAGDVFRERPDFIYDGRNKGDRNTVVIATFYGVPVGGAARIDQPNPHCG